MSPGSQKVLHGQGGQSWNRFPREVVMAPNEVKGFKECLDSDLIHMVQFLIAL